MANPTSWNTETSRDASGNVVVTITAAGPQSQVYQQAWTSGTANPKHPAHTASVLLDEVVTQGPLLLASVKAGTIVPGKTSISTPSRTHSGY